MEAPLEMPPLDLSGVNAAPDNGDARYARNPDGSVKYKKDGRPALKRGRKLGSTLAKQRPLDTTNQLLADDEDAKEFVKGLVEEITSPEQLADIIAATFAIPAALVDESFDLTDNNGQPNQRCKIAARRLFPLCKKYGTASLAQWMPEILAVWGIIELARPSVGPVIEIVAGVRQPLIFRGVDNAALPVKDASPSPSPTSVT